MELRHRVMLAYINGRQQGLPARYQKVAYLESTGVQYLVLPFTPSTYSQYKISVDVEGTFETSDYINIYGSVNDTAPRNGLRVWKARNANKMVVQSGGTSTSGITVPSGRFTDIVEVKLNSIKHSIGSSSETLETLNISNNHSFCLFGTFLGDSFNSSGAFLGKIFSFKAETNSIFCNLVPCYDTENGNKPGMYDLVSRQFLVNQGTGADFIVGPDVHDLPAEFQEVDGLTPQDGAYIDTGLTTSNYTSYNLKGTITTPTIEENNVYLFKNQSGDIKVAKFVNNTSNVRLYVSCYRKTDNVAGMYDLITKQFKTNSGTGSFIVGPDIN